LRRGATAKTPKLGQELMKNIGPQVKNRPKQTFKGGKYDFVKEKHG